MIKSDALPGAVWSTIFRCPSRLDTHRITQRSFFSRADVKACDQGSDPAAAAAANPGELSKRSSRPSSSSKERGVKTLGDADGNNNKSGRDPVTTTTASRRHRSSSKETDNKNDAAQAGGGKRLRSLQQRQRRRSKSTSSSGSLRRARGRTSSSRCGAWRELDHERRGDHWNTVQAGAWGT